MGHQVEPVLWNVTICPCPEAAGTAGLERGLQARPLALELFLHLWLLLRHRRYSSSLQAVSPIGSFLPGKSQAPFLLCSVLYETGESSVAQASLELAEKLIPWCWDNSHEAHVWVGGYFLSRTGFIPWGAHCVLLPSRCGSLSPKLWVYRVLCSDFPVPTGRMLSDLGRMAKPCLSGPCNVVRSLSRELTPSSELLGVLVAALGL